MISPFPGSRTRLAVAHSFYGNSRRCLHPWARPSGEGLLPQDSAPPPPGPQEKAPPQVRFYMSFGNPDCVLLIVVYSLILSSTQYPELGTVPACILWGTACLGPLVPLQPGSSKERLRCIFAESTELPCANPVQQAHAWYGLSPTVQGAASWQ